MKYKGHKLLFTVLIIFFIMLLGIKGTAMLVNEYLRINNDMTVSLINKEENMKNFTERYDSYFVEKENFYYQMPKDALIRINSSTQNYMVIFDTAILDKPNGLKLRDLQKEEILSLNKLEGEYGLFRTSDNTIGYVNLGDLEILERDYISYGISKVDKVINNGDKFYVLAKGELVSINNYIEGKFIIVDDLGAEFIIDEDYLDIRTAKEQVSRSSISRRTKSLTKIISSAYSKLGKPYVYGDAGNRGYDCSGLTYSIYLNELGLTLPRSSHVQVNAGTRVEKADLVPGDILFFNTSGTRISHVGLYIGDGNMIHASSGKMQVRIDSIDSGYYSSRYVTARRIIKQGD